MNTWNSNELSMLIEALECLTDKLTLIPVKSLGEAKDNYESITEAIKLAHKLHNMMPNLTEPITLKSTWAMYRHLCCADRIVNIMREAEAK